MFFALGYVEYLTLTAYCLCSPELVAYCGDSDQSTPDVKMLKAHLPYAYAKAMTQHFFCMHCIGAPL